MSRQQAIWVIVAAIQLVPVAWAAMRLRNGSRASHWAVGVVLISVGTIIIAADILWIVTGGAEGRSPIGMRGGWFGFGLTLLIAVECLGLGLLMIVQRKRQEFASHKGSSASVGPH